VKNRQHQAMTRVKEAFDASPKPPGRRWKFTVIEAGPE
jgi:hypothetical protein